MRNAIPSQFDLMLAVATLVVAGALAVTHQRQPRSRPEESVARLFGALASKDLEALRAELDPATYEDFLRTFGAQKLERVQVAYERAYRLGEAHWLQLRAQSDRLARQDYDRLRLRVTGLGRDAFSALAVDDRLRLMDNPELFQEFLFEHGVSALSPTDRARIGSASEFRLGQDVDRFLARERFDALPAEEKALVGSLAALSDGQTVEKLALHDKFGFPLLSSDLRDEIGSISRAELRNTPAFELEYGEPLAKQFLLEHRIPVDPGPRSCSYPWPDERGSLLRGDEAICDIALQLQQGAQAASIRLVKQGFGWRIAGIRPALTELLMVRIP